MTNAIRQTKFPRCANWSTLGAAMWGAIPTLGRSCSIAIDPTGKRDVPSNLDANLQALSGPPEVVAQAIRAFADEGIDHIQAYMVPSTIESVEWLAKVIEILDQ